MLVAAEARSQEHPTGLSPEWRGSKYLSPHLLCPMMLEQEAAEQEDAGGNKCVWDAGIQSGNERAVS